MRSLLVDADLSLFFLRQIYSSVLSRSLFQKSNMIPIYAGCITSLATLSTLSGVTESNMDTIELSLVEAKKWLALLLIRSNNGNEIKLIKEEAYLFTTGQYTQLLEKASIHPFKPINQSSEKYAYLHNQPLKQLLSAADTMLQLIIKVGSQDKRLLL
jgi:hypothetical protein